MAVADLGSKIAVPLGCLHRSPGQKFGDAKGMAADLQPFITRFQPVLLVVGYPIEMDSTIGPQCRLVEQFVYEMQEAGVIAGPVFFQDERFSTQGALKQGGFVSLNQRANSKSKTRHVSSNNTKKHPRHDPQQRERLDMESAVWILQAFLDRLHP